GAPCPGRRGGGCVAAATVSFSGRGRGHYSPRRAAIMPATPPGVAEPMWKYTDLVMEHLKNPRNVGEIDAPDAFAEVSNPVCGDTLRLTVRFEDGRVAEARFKTRGCGAAIATSSV